MARCSNVTVDDISILIKKSFAPKNADVHDFQLKPFSTETLGYLGVHELLTIEVQERDKPESKKTMTFFVKKLATSCNDYQRLAFDEEHKFFRDVVPKLLRNCKADPWAANCYMAKDDMLVLEDLRSQGFKVANGPLTEKQVKLALASLARFHASSMLLEDELGIPLSKVYPGFFEEKLFLEDKGFNLEWMLAGIEVAETVARDLGLNHKHVSMAYECLLENIKLKDGERAVLCHGDLWSNNMIFSEDSCRLVDFQMVVYRTYAVDLVQFIHINVGQDARRRLEGELLQLYHSVLDESLRMHGYRGQMISLKEVARAVEEKRVCGLVTAVQLLPICSLNKELNEEFTEDANKLQNYMYTTRRYFICRAMELDSDYRFRIEEVVRDLIEFMENSKNRETARIIENM